MLGGRLWRGLDVAGISKAMRMRMMKFKLLRHLALAGDRAWVTSSVVHADDIVNTAVGAGSSRHWPRPSKQLS